MLFIISSSTIVNEEYFKITNNNKREDNFKKINISFLKNEVLLLL